MVAAILHDARKKKCITEPKHKSCELWLLRRDNRLLVVVNDSALAQQASKEYVVIYQTGEQILLPV